MEIIFTPLAKKHLRELKAYISRKSYPSRAEAYVGRILDYCEGLSTFPERGTKRDDILRDLRVVGVEKNTSIAFVVMEDRVLIEGVFYGGRSVEKALKPRK